MFKKIASVLMATAIAPVAMAQNPSLEDRISELEANSSLNIFNFSGIFNTRYDSLSVKQAKPVDATLADNKNLGYLRMRVSLNADANVSKNVKFYSRFTTSKHFNKWTTIQSGSAPSTTGTDLRASDNYNDSSVVLEKAYLDMTIPDTNFIISLGRLPTPDGQPSNYWDGRARLGTYPLMSYSSVLDGMAVTYKVDEYMPEGHKLSVRAIYAPFSSYTVGSKGYQTFPTNDTTGTNNQFVNTFTDFATGQIDYSTTNIGIADNFGLILQYNELQGLPVAGGAAVASNLSFGLKASSVAAELNGVASLPIDLSVSVLGSEVVSKGLLPSGVGYGTTKAEASTYGSFTLVSTRYRTASWLFGVEYGKGTEGVFYSGGTAEDLTNMYGTPGTLIHGYVTKKFTDNLSLRLGYYTQQEDYTRLGGGNVAEADKKITVGYANFRADF